MRSLLFFLLACLAAAVVPFLSVGLPERAASEAFPGWPDHFEGRALRPLALSERELRFSDGFPGEVARFSDGTRELILRWVTEETRKLHPAADCFRGSGYHIVPEPITVDAAGTAWGTFTATRGAEVLRVRERIYDARGQAWTDVSAWYWAAFRGRTEGPWWTVTIAEKQAGGSAG